MNKDVSVANLGNLNYLGAAFKKAEEEKKLSIVYLGGSITQGCHATAEDKRYVNLSAKWWGEKFPSCEVEMFNAGIGATTSQFGAARVGAHVLSHKPDVVFVEFSVNDDDSVMFMETYESLIRRLLKDGNIKAVVLINNLFYATGLNAQNVHNAVGRHYGLPIVSVRDYVYPKILLGEIDPKVYSTDMLHPTDIGHETIAALIKNLLDKEYELYKASNTASFTKPALAEKLTKCRYEDAEIFNNTNSSPVLEGFTANTHRTEWFSDPFKDGFIGSKKGDSITFEVEGSIIMIQWRRTIKQPAPVAFAIIDGKEAVKLDANFEEDWGDLCCLSVLTETAEKGKTHTVKIVIDEEGTASDFMVISVIAAGK